MLGAAALIVLSQMRPQDYLRDVEWDALLFFAGLFILVGALIKVGVIDLLAEGLGATTGDSPGRAMMLLLWASAVLSGILDNVTGIAKRSGHPISFWTFIQYGLPAEPLRVMLRTHRPRPVTDFERVPRSRSRRS